MSVCPCVVLSYRRAVRLVAWYGVRGAIADERVVSTGFLCLSSRMSGRVSVCLLLMGIPRLAAYALAIVPLVSLRPLL